MNILRPMSLFSLLTLVAILALSASVAPSYAAVRPWNIGDMNAHLGPAINPSWRLAENNAHPEKQRVIILGLDGFSFRILDEMAAAGALPNFKKVMEGGTRVSLESTDFPSSAVAWPSIVTGSAPKNTGMHSFFLLDPKSYELNLINATYRQRRALWEIASGFGKRSIVVNMPMSYPVDKLNGVMVGGLLSDTSETFTTPAVLSEGLRTLGYIPSYLPLKPRRKVGEDPFSAVRPDFDFGDMQLNSINRLNLFLYFQDRIDWDLGIAVFTLPDRLQHNQHSIGAETIETSYAQMDFILATMLQRLPDNTSLLMVADHGFRSYEQGFYLSHWLQENDYLALNSKGEPVWSKSRLIPVDRVGTTATLRWNVRDREADGIVSEKDARPGSKLWEELERELREMKTLDGEPLLRSISAIPAAEPAEGASAPPEILLTFHPDVIVNMAFYTPEQSLVRIPQPYYDHEATGVGIFYHPEVFKPKAKITADVEDVAPLAMHLLRLPLSEQFDGKVPVSALEEEWLEAHPIETEPYPVNRDVKRQSSQHDPEAVERLRSLGYTGN